MGGDDDAITSPAPPYCGSTLSQTFGFVVFSFCSNTSITQLLSIGSRPCRLQGAGSGSNDHHPRESDTSEHAERRVGLHIDRAMRTVSRLFYYSFT